MNIKPLNVGPIIKGPINNNNSTVFWGKTKNSHKFIILRYKPINNTYTQPIINDLDNNIGRISVELNKNTTYIYQIGSIEDTSTEYNWSALTEYKFHTEKDTDLSFVFGSCRRLMDIGPITLCGSGKPGDKIYECIKEHDPDFFMSIGDQVYFDPMNSFLRRKSLKDMRNLYDKVWSYPCIKSLHATTPTYMICDDHDCHRNNSNYASRIKEKDIYDNGMRCYMDYQHYSGNINDNMWYTFDVKNATFFVFDTRSQRDERLQDSDGNKRQPTIVSKKQMNEYRKWIMDVKNADKFKFIVSPVPVVSQADQDSWYGFEKQQNELISVMIGIDDDGNDIENAYILTGDAHCCRIGIYDVFIGDGNTHKQVKSILSSGLFAINHDVGKKWNGSMIGYDVDNDFKCITHIGKYKFVTNYNSESYPRPSNKCSFRKLFQITDDNTFANVRIHDGQLVVEFYNHKNQLLYRDVI